MADQHDVPQGRGRAGRRCSAGGSGGGVRAGAHGVPPGFRAR
ncbi:hypothetical protein SLNWT_6405 [Streptomyces albus]|uniref:Uncharacterized protein n=1 Tax=Streptomyces albus (strain ATCC 21838 / DSM 41398 / FERM P-419 / JCM 4703 / NBRC 107858) TaxID=1081613 RepID=A0A0B5F7E5_STRA4|nr:hypothetical protein SLNWT_6405 [Streptomyces albus]AOU81085.1 hypothetical protein SLNHY_6394 [Streptomyces albus]